MDELEEVIYRLNSLHQLSSQGFSLNNYNFLTPCINKLTTHKECLAQQKDAADKVCLNQHKILRRQGLTHCKFCGDGL